MKTAQLYECSTGTAKQLFDWLINPSAPNSYSNVLNYISQLLNKARGSN